MQLTTDGEGMGDRRNQRILIIDDNAAIHEDVRKILGMPDAEDAALDAEAAELFGVAAEGVGGLEFEIDSAFQGQEGLKMVQRALDEGRPYAMAFVDVRMPPGWDGVETISRIWQLYPELQVVICTAYSDYSWEEMIRQVGKTDSLVILKKPFDNIEVLQLAHTLTQKWTLSHRLQSHIVGLDAIVARRTEELQSANTRLRLEIDEREQAEKELRRSEERFAKAFQSSPIPMAIQSLATERFLDVNEAFLTIAGMRRLEVISRDPKELDISPSSDTNAELFAQLRREKSVRNLPFQLQSRTLGLRECLLSAEALQLGTEVVALIAMQDVTEQRSLELQLRHSQKLEAVGQFAAGVAHDFNNMLTIIQGHASLQLGVDDLDSDVASSLLQMSHAAERAASLTKQLLMFSRKQVVQPRLLDLTEVVGNLEPMLSRLIGEHIKLRCELEQGLPAIFADESNIEQVVVNLAANARDAMEHSGNLVIRNGTVTVDAAHIARNPQARMGNHVRLSVADTGCGMSPETLSHMFEPFFTTKGVGKGTGLGLATVYGIVAQHEGWIEVSTALGQGSVFHVFLPAQMDAAEATKDAEILDVRGGHETILVVEDEPGVREVMTQVLRHHGYSVLEASDGVEAVRVWSANGGHVDLLLTDIVMPNGMRGNALADRLRTEKAGLKVIFSSGYSPEFGTNAAPLDHQINFLEKPYKSDLLVKTVRDCLDS